MSHFTHSPLLHPESEVRLVILHPGRPYESVHCELKTIPSIHTEPYEALSYCWGSPPVTNTIFVNGKSLQVSPNLEHALRNLRYRGRKNRKLWIDAICIDQSSHHEKNAQVPRMGSIYNTASRVVVWVGRDHEPDDDLLDWSPAHWGFSTIGKGSKESTAQVWLLVRTLAWQYAQRRGQITQPESDEEKALSERDAQLAMNNFNTAVEYSKRQLEAWANLSRIFRRKWFERLWTIQEVVLATQVVLVCGTQAFNWEDLKDAIKLFIIIRGALVEGGLYFVSQMGVERMQRILDCSENRGIFNLLRVTQYQSGIRPGIQVTMEHDILFGLMGMLVDSSAIRVDYSKEYKLVYTDWASRAITNTKSLDVLSLCADPSTNGFPSWVPDLSNEVMRDATLFSMTHSISIMPGTGISPLALFSASGPVYASVDFNRSSAKRSSSISLPARLLGSIHTLAPPILDENSSHEQQSSPHLLQQRMQSIEDLLIPPGSITDPLILSQKYTEFAKALTRGQLPPLIRNIDTQSHYGRTKVHEQYEQWRGRLKLPFFWSSSADEEVMFEKSATFEKMLLAFLFSTQMFVTESGEFGVVADNCHVRGGDQVFILKGGKTPFVFRKNGDGTYRLMGPCYLYGAMQGEKAPVCWAKDLDDYSEGSAMIEIV